MTPDSCARIHAAAFAGQGRGWSAAEFRDLVASPAVFLAAPGPHCFALGRVVADEAELITLAVAPPYQGTGLGHRGLAAFEAEARIRGATEAFLEVAADNPVAIRLYRSAGYAVTGRRPAYYTRAGTPADALTMRKPLS